MQKFLTSVEEEQTNLEVCGIIQNAPQLGNISYGTAPAFIVYITCILSMV